MTLIIIEIITILILTYHSSLIGAVISNSKMTKAPQNSIKWQCNDLCNYRPVSILSSLKKFVEKLIKKRLFPFQEI